MDGLSAPDGTGAICRLLTAAGKLDPQSTERAARLSRDSGEPVEQILTKLGLVPERDLAEAYCTHLGTSRHAWVPSVDYLDDPLKGSLSDAD